jgi:putative ABC transport system permease protein
VLGVLGSYALLSLIGGSAGLDVEGIHVEPLALIQGGAFGLAVPLVAAFLPVWRGASVTVREAMLSYGLVSNFGRGLGGRIARAMGFLPPIWMMAARNLLRNQMRVLLTVLALGAAGASIISVYNASNSLGASVREGVKTYNADIVVQVNESIAGPRILPLINGITGVQSTEGWFTAGAEVGGDTAFRVTGLPARPSGYDITKVSSGRWFEPNETNVVVITEEMARKQGYKLEEEIEITIGNDTAQRRVVGITRDLLSGDSTFYAPIEEVTKAIGAPPDAVQTVLVKLDDSSRDNVDRTSDQIGEVLNNAGIPARTLIVYQIEENITEGYSGLFVLQYIVVIIVTIVGALGLFGTLTMNILERRREIGVLRAVGASNRKILSLFLIEGLLLGLVGWALAVVLGLFASQWFGNLVSSLLLPLTVTVSLRSLILTLVVIIAVAFFATLLPSLGASRTRIAEILRYS